MWRPADRVRRVFWSIVHSHFDRGQGLAGRNNLRAAGVPGRWITRRVDRGDLVAVHPNVIAAPGLTMDLPARYRAAILQAGWDAALSHVSALHIYGLLEKPPHGPVHVSAPSVSRQVPGLRIHKRRARGMCDVDGFPVVPVKEAIVGAVGQMDISALRFPAMQACHEGLLTASDLADLSGAPRSALRVLRLMGEEALAGAESGGEANFFR